MRGPSRTRCTTTAALGRRVRDRLPQRGAATGVLQVRSADAALPTRTHTVEPGKQVTGVWPADTGLDLSVHGPNGFFRRGPATTPAARRWPWS
ncbi:phospholipase domain-containing protein [Dactylosporangium sp. NPDC051484]|uniref:phospholipase domain-containing protein n=1 Tax=Dactylosporangium sp. NPDC051484 TaxID=3154942 RepID=UPI00344F6E9C